MNINSNMTWFIFPIMSVDTSGVEISKLKHCHVTAAE